MEVKAKAKYIRMSPRKVRLVIDLIRGLEIFQAETQLNFLRKAAVRPVLKLLNSAVANAENDFKLKKENLYIKSITCDSGPTLKRWKPRAFGRATPIRKRSSHISIILDERVKGKESDKKIDQKVEEKKVEEKKIKVVESLEKFRKTEAQKVDQESKKDESKKEMLKKEELSPKEAAPQKGLKKSKGFLKKLFTRKTG